MRDGDVSKVQDDVLFRGGKKNLVKNDWCLVSNHSK